MSLATRLGDAGPNPAARSLRYGSPRTLGLVLGEPLTVAPISDLQTVGVLRAAEAANVCVPVSLKVSGWDDSPAAPENRLSSVLRARGVACARLALGEGGNRFTDE